MARVRAARRGRARRGRSDAEGGINRGAGELFGAGRCRGGGGGGGGGGGWGLTRPGSWEPACLFIYLLLVGAAGVCARSRCSAGRGWGEGPRRGELEPGSKRRVTRR